MCAAPGVDGSDRETFAAPVPPALQDRAPAPGAHPLTKTVHLLAAAVVWLKCALHVEKPRLLKGESRSFTRATESTQWRPRGSRRSGSAPPAPCRQQFRCAAGTRGRIVRPAVGPRRESLVVPQARRKPFSQRASRAPFTRDVDMMSSIGISRQLISGRNGFSRNPVRPDRFVDNCVDKVWTGCAFVGTKR